MKPTLEQVKAFLESDIDAPQPPGPYEIALHLAGALLSSGRFGEDPSAAVTTAWTLVIPFYQGQAAYEAHGRQLFELARHASAAEPDMTRQEGRSYVTGGETGDTGEAGRLGSATITLPSTEAAAASQLHVAASNQRAARAWEAWQAALAAAGDDANAPAVLAARQAFDEAALIQSAAHLPPGPRELWLTWQRAKAAGEDEPADEEAFREAMAGQQ